MSPGSPSLPCTTSQASDPVSRQLHNPPPSKSQLSPPITEGQEMTQTKTNLPCSGASRRARKVPPPLHPPQVPISPVTQCKTSLNVQLFHPSLSKGVSPMGAPRHCLLTLLQGAGPVCYPVVLPSTASLIQYRIRLETLRLHYQSCTVVAGKTAERKISISELVLQKAHTIFLLCLN